MAQLTWNQVQAPNMRDANMLMSDAMDRQGIGGAMIAKSLGNIGQDIQNRRDAEYYAQMNQYANDPLGMAQALQSGAINQNGVSQDALQRGREYLSSAATNWKNNTETERTQYIQDQYKQHKYTLDAIFAAGQSGNEGAYNSAVQQFIKDGGDVQVLKDLGLNYTKQQLALDAARLGLAREQHEQQFYDAYIQEALRKMGLLDKKNIEAYQNSGELDAAAIYRGIKNNLPIAIPDKYIRVGAQKHVLSDLNYYHDNQSNLGQPVPKQQGSYFLSSETKQKLDEINRRLGGQ